MYGNWANAAMALHRLDAAETRLQNARARAAELFDALNKLPGIQIKALEGGTNIYQLQLGKAIDGKKLQANLRIAFIRMGMPDAGNKVLISVNETLLYRDADYVVNAFKKAIA